MPFRLSRRECGNRPSPPFVQPAGGRPSPWSEKRPPPNERVGGGALVLDSKMGWHRPPSDESLPRWPGLAAPREVNSRWEFSPDFWQGVEAAPPGPPKANAAERDSLSRAREEWPAGWTADAPCRGVPSPCFARTGGECCNRAERREHAGHGPSFVLPDDARRNVEHPLAWITSSPRYLSPGVDYYHSVGNCVNCDSPEKTARGCTYERSPAERGLLPQSGKGRETFGGGSGDGCMPGHAQRDPTGSSLTGFFLLVLVVVLAITIGRSMGRWEALEMFMANPGGFSSLARPSDRVFAP